MARRKKLNISNRASNNEGTQSIPTNGDSTSVHGSDGADTPSGLQRSDGAETRPGPSQAVNVIHESVESHSIPSDIEAEEEHIVEGINYIPFSILFVCVDDFKKFLCLSFYLWM